MDIPNRRLTVLRALFLLGFVFAVSMTVDAPRNAVAQSSWTILEYDDQGRVVGIKKGKGASTGSHSSDDTDTRDGRSKPVESGELLVAEPPAGMMHRVISMGYTVLGEWNLDFLHMTLVRLKIPSGTTVPDALEELRGAFPLANIDTNDLLELSSGGDRRRVQIAQNKDYARRTVGWGSVPASCGTGMLVGMIDGAIDIKHPALKTQDLHYRNFIEGNRKPAAGDHGTAVAAMLIGHPDSGSGGLLPAAKLYAANIFEARKEGATGNLAAMIRAVDWIGKSGAKVVNLSIAGSQNVLMRLAINRAVGAGLIMVAAAGNRGPGAEPVWPAAHEDAFAVTAIDRKLERYRLANIGTYIDFAAPGVDIPVQTPHGVKLESGTSMATPFITAIVAIHLDAGFDASPRALRKSMKRYVRDLGEKGHDEKFGWGLVRLKPKC